MKPYYYGGAQGSLIKTGKDTWKSGVTNGWNLFGHGGPMEPSIVHAMGLTPDKASEFLVDRNDQRISGGKMLFSFLISQGLQLPAVPEKPAGVGRFWGFDGHMYVFKVPPQTTYWTQNGVITHGAEVAFEYVVESTDIVAYWAPSKNFIMRPGQKLNPRKNFQAVSWQAYLTSRTHA